MPEPVRHAIVCGLFDCSDETAQRIGALAAWRERAAGDHIAHQGGDHRTCELLTRGTVELRTFGPDGRCFQIATVEVGEPFGVYPEAAVMAADAIARDPVEYVSIDAAALARIAQDDADVGASLAQLFAGQLQMLVGRYAARLTLSATGRVYDQLLRSLDGERRIAPVPVVAGLAVQAQTTRETASRAIGALERRGILERHSDCWIITAPRMLEDLLV